MIKKNEMLPFFKCYASRYGEHRMNQETKVLWYEQLKHFELEQFKAATDLLLGGEELAFGWKKVVKRIAELFGGNEPTQQAQERQWIDAIRHGDAGEKERIKMCTNYLNGISQDITNSKLTLADGKNAFWLFVSDQDLIEHFRKPDIAEMIDRRFERSKPNG